MTMTPAPVTDIAGARVLAVLGDSVTTDHISPAGPSRQTAPPANIYPPTASSPPTSTPTARAAAITKSWCAAPSPTCACATSSRPALKAASRACSLKASQMSIFDASVKYAERRDPLIILAGKEYGSGSSRDWAAKGPKLLGVRAVIAESFERIHRSNLVGMGILPLQFEAGQNVESLGLTGEETYDILGLPQRLDEGSGTAGRSRS